MTIYCEARTTTGLGCDSLGLEQCPKCLTMPLMLRACEIEEATKRRSEAYQCGLFGPRYQVPAIAYQVAWLGWCVAILTKNEGEGLNRLYPD